MVTGKHGSASKGQGRSAVRRYFRESCGETVILLLPTKLYPCTCDQDPKGAISGFMVDVFLRTSHKPVNGFPAMDVSTNILSGLTKVFLGSRVGGLSHVISVRELLDGVDVVGKLVGARNI